MFIKDTYGRVCHPYLDDMPTYQELLIPGYSNPTLDALKACHNGLHDIRNKKYLDGEGIFHLAERLMSWIQDQEHARLGGWFTRKWWIVPECYTLLAGRSGSSQPNIYGGKAPKLGDPNQHGDRTQDAHNFNRALFTVHFVHFSRPVEHWAVVIRQGSTGNTWYMDSVRRTAAARSEKAKRALSDWLQRSGLRDPEAAVHTLVQCREQEDSWSCGLHAIANAMAFIRFEALGWGQIPAWRNVDERQMRTQLAESLHNLMGLRWNLSPTTSIRKPVATGQAKTKGKSKQSQAGAAEQSAAAVPKPQPKAFSPSSGKAQPTQDEAAQKSTATNKPAAAKKPATGKAPTAAAIQAQPKAASPPVTKAKTKGNAQQAQDKAAQEPTAAKQPVAAKTPAAAKEAPAATVRPPTTEVAAAASQTKAKGKSQQPQDAAGEESTAAKQPAAAKEPAKAKQPAAAAVKPQAEGGSSTAAGQANARGKPESTQDEVAGKLATDAVRPQAEAKPKKKMDMKPEEKTAGVVGTQPAASQTLQTQQPNADGGHHAAPEGAVAQHKGKGKAKPPHPSEKQKPKMDAGNEKENNNKKAAAKPPVKFGVRRAPRGRALAAALRASQSAAAAPAQQAQKNADTAKPTAGTASDKNAAAAAGLTTADPTTAGKPNDTAAKKAVIRKPTTGKRKEVSFSCSVEQQRENDESSPRRKKRKAAGIDLGTADVDAIEPRVATRSMNSKRKAPASDGAAAEEPEAKRRSTSRRG
ncbi:hypothetical protein VTK56DRAFT_8177 [Thermocarpiscus australiensis]